MKKKSIFDNIREYENLHIALWLLKDICWCLSGRIAFMKLPGMLMIIPTLSVAVHITWRRRHLIPDFFHNIAICLWLCANAIWMTGEFFYDDGLRDYALVFFIAGLMVVSFYYIVLFPKRKKELENLSQE